jgi:hypothetical protein
MTQRSNAKLRKCKLKRVDWMTQTRKEVKTCLEGLLIPDQTLTMPALRLAGDPNLLSPILMNVWYQKWK